MWGGKVHQGDCEALMNSMASQSVDLIVTSPPYADARIKIHGGAKPDKYVEWFLPKAMQMYRILKPTGSFILNIKERCQQGERHTYVLELIMALRELGFLWTEEYIWYKKTPMPGKWPNRFRDAWERLLHFTITKDFKMNQEAVMVPSRYDKKDSNRKNKRITYENTKFGINRSRFHEKDMSYPSNVLFLAGSMKKHGHGAPFPEGIPEFFIKLLTDEGDTVLDPFSGTHTTFHVAKRLGRIPIGMEINPEYARP